MRRKRERKLREKRERERERERERSLDEMLVKLTGENSVFEYPVASIRTLNGTFLCVCVEYQERKIFLKLSQFVIFLVS